jgi:hypothetical protein
MFMLRIEHDRCWFFIEPELNVQKTRMFVCPNCFFFLVAGSVIRVNTTDAILIDLFSTISNR